MLDHTLLNMSRAAVLILSCTALATQAQSQSRLDDRSPNGLVRVPGAAQPHTAARPVPRAAAPRPSAPVLRLDQRYRHDHYYPHLGYLMPALPGGSLSITFGNANLFFHGGVWFRPQAGHFVVIMPPLGITIPVLPPAYVSLWMDGIPYYYANGVYYAASPGQGYVVVAPPPGAQDIQPPPIVRAPVVPPEPIIYPRAGQTPAQTEADRQECNRWATTQPSALADASVFLRAVAACMDGRGYTVR